MNNDIRMIQRIYENNIYKRGMGAMFGPNMIQQNIDFVDYCEKRAQPIVRWALSKGLLTTNSCGGHKLGDPIQVDFVPNIEAWKYDLYCGFGGGYESNDPMNPDNLSEKELIEWRKKIKKFTSPILYKNLKSKIENMIPRMKGVSVRFIHDESMSPENNVVLSVGEDVYDEFIKRIGDSSYSVSKIPLKKIKLSYNPKNHQYTY